MEGAFSGNISIFLIFKALFADFYETGMHSGVMQMSFGTSLETESLV